jgi:hypothetical protein
MMALDIIGEALGGALGTLGAAALFCWLAWNLFKPTHHPEFGVPILLTAVLLIWNHAFASSLFLRVAEVYAGLAAVALLPAGIAWRRRNILPPRQGKG